ncbi:MAG: PKD domain-containing protein [Bacteroidales bacterium]|nr:PKD domain-containing protein [Bacteroidales bacterium]
MNQPPQFTDTSQSNGATLLTYRWLFDDPLSVYDTAVVRNPSYTYPAPGTYNPQLVLTNQAGCRDTATTAITVYGLPAASFNHSLSCVGQPTLFFDHSDPYLAPLYLWGWRVSDSLTALSAPCRETDPSSPLTRQGPITSVLPLQIPTSVPIPFRLLFIPVLRRSLLSPTPRMWIMCRDSCSSPMVPSGQQNTTGILATERYLRLSHPLSPMLKTVLTPSPL